MTEVPAAPSPTAVAHFEARLAFETDCWDVHQAGPHCNAAQKGAGALARLGRPVKEMIGGISGWIDEGFSLETADIS